MLQKGNWVGQYTFGNPAHNKLRGFEHTTFHVDVTSVNKNNFIGRVQDDLSTGGTEGIGEISGKVTGKLVEFVKQMPIMTLFSSKTGARITQNRKHSKIYYSGIISDDGKSISGNWKFRFSIIWIGFIPYFSRGEGGTWKMVLVEQENE